MSIQRYQPAVPAPVESKPATELKANKFGVWAKDQNGRLLVVEWSHVYNWLVEGDTLRLCYRDRYGDQEFVLVGESLEKWSTFVFIMLGGNATSTEIARNP